MKRLRKAELLNVLSSSYFDGENPTGMVQVLARAPLGHVAY